MMKTLCLAALAALTVAGLVPAQERQGDNGQVEATKLVGTYHITGGEKFGKAIPPQELRDNTVRIADDTITVLDRDSKQVYAATYQLNPMGDQPWRITMTSTLAPVKGVVARGLIQRQGDTVRLIYALPEGKLPTEFKTGEKQLMFVLKKGNGR